MLYLICGYFSQSDSPKVHLLSLRQLSHNKCRSRVCVFCCERAKRSINRSEISIFKQHVSPCSILKWDLYYVFMKFLSSNVLGFLLLVLVVCEINTVHLQGPTQWKDLWLFHTQNNLIDHVQSQDWMVTTWRRQRINTKPRTERIYINCGIIFDHGKYYSLRN